MNLSQVLPRLFVGSCPADTSDISRLKTEFGITAILNLQTDHDLDCRDLDWPRSKAQCRELEIELHRVAINDHDGRDLLAKLPDCVQSVDELLSSGHTVYVHCNVGVSRSPTVVLAYLVWRLGWNLDDATEHVTRCRPCSAAIKAIVRASRDRVAA
ncbi:MAG: dual specificity protein phosphatase family protein [Thermoguttaceae bacterium]|jgi:atypical dual specificity phosphatase